MIIVVVGFKITEENSTFYKKIKEAELLEDRDRVIGKVMAKALIASDFVSVRKIGK